MKFKFFFIFIFITSCSSNLTTINQKKTFTSKGFALIYNELDYDNKVIKGKMNNDIMQISHQNLKTGTLIKIINSKNKKNITLKNIKRIQYPDFYKILITKAVAKKLQINPDLPIIEIIEIKKNKSFIAEKAKIFNEEKKVTAKAPVGSVQISNISKNKIDLKKVDPDPIFIHIASFYSIDTAKLLKQRIIKELVNYDNKKLNIKKISNKETQLLSGPYTSVNLLKNDYIKLKNFGFEELNIFINE